MIAGGNSWLSAGFWNQIGGMDGSKSPDLIGPAFYALGVNVAIRGGKPTTRPGFSRIETTPVGVAGEYLNNFPCNGAFGYYSPTEARTEVFFASGGKLLRLTPDTGVLEDLTPSTGDFEFYKPCYFVQAERFLVVQNGVDIPWVYDGSVVRQSRFGATNPDKTISSLTRSGALATLVTTTAHGFSSGDYVQVEGMTPDLWNGYYFVDRVDDTTVQFICNSTLTTPATGSGQVRFAPEVPTGTIMAYGQGRLFVASPDRDTFRAGDVIYGDVLGTDKNLLRFTETSYLSEGGDFSFPLTMGRITGMSFIPQQDTATGQGDLMVRGEYGVASFAVAEERSKWKSTQVQRITFTGIGGVSPDGEAFMNNDLFFRTSHGIQSYRQARADLNSYGQTLVSSEVARIVDLDDPRLLGGVSGATYDSRVFFTCAPERLPRSSQILSILRSGGAATVTVNTPHGMSATGRVVISDTESYDGEYVIESAVSPTEFVINTGALSSGDELSGDGFASFPDAPSFTTYRGMVSLDFHALAMVGNRASAAYDGIWTGLNIYKLLSGRGGGSPKLYAVRCNRSVGAELWEMTHLFRPDFLRGVESPQQCALETRAFDFEKPFTLKKLARADLWLSELRGAVSFRVLYRADGHPCWVPWADFSFCVPVDQPEIPENDPLSPTTPRALPQSRVQRRLPAPSDDCDPANQKLLRTGYSFQFRLEWTGVCRVEKFLAHALETAEQMGGGCL